MRPHSSRTSSPCCYCLLPCAAGMPPACAASLGTQKACMYIGSILVPNLKGAVLSSFLLLGSKGSIGPHQHNTHYLQPLPCHDGFHKPSRQPGNCQAFPRSCPEQVRCAVVLYMKASQEIPEAVRLRHARPLQRCHDLLLVNGQSSHLRLAAAAAAVLSRARQQRQQACRGSHGTRAVDAWPCEGLLMQAYKHPSQQGATAMADLPSWREALVSTALRCCDPAAAKSQQLRRSTCG